MNALLHPTYIPNIATFAVIAQNAIKWEFFDNFQKQTLRNRAYICTDRGELMLNIPIKHVGKGQGRQLYKDVKLENDYKWQRQHWRALQTAYRTSPYFEFYEDEIAPLYTKTYTHLLDYNLKSIEIICSCLQIDMPTIKTKSYTREPTEDLDLRHFASAKKQIALAQPEYVQVFGDRHGFIKNASTLDLLFNEGTNALSYLKNLNINPENA
ncbi:MAG: WbqC family protein [Maribacter sp.]